MGACLRIGMVWGLGVDVCRSPGPAEFGKQGTPGREVAPFAELVACATSPVPVDARPTRARSSWLWAHLWAQPQNLNTRISTPWSRRWVANECLSTCGVTRLLIPKASAVSQTTR